ncbi:bifunctional diaminohydroxyphosphoribosylaminopyrimidine deaminase/5-amino-6-(5-phosphoribosylamino)uracil reductase RibD [Candidatus Aerophobetes bacterium]|nr:bifunctional diaminohydroxyphosphoribosylaminopyrimidine deaminase/5-amino-6-(5-phosphoribosylamino)uracil reductase RibD [Candidatus Aerophobetes bacterium]
MVSEEKWMKLAISLARRGEGKVSPNPVVGAVLIKNGNLIGKGYHRYFGGPHAEIEAIKDAGEKVRGSTLFVTLEPCCHFGKTPPCTKAIIKAGIKKVVVATLDPNPLNNGRGVEILRKAGIDVKVGVCEKEARKINEFFFKFIREKIPYVILKAAASLDGKIATYKGESKWITGERSRKLGKKLRSKVDAILVGINTVIKDNPQLLPLKSRKRFFRVILDTKLRIPPGAKVLEEQLHYPTFIFTSSKANREKIRSLKEKNVKVRVLEDCEDRVNLKKVLRELGKEGIASLLVEGGGEVIASFIEENLADRIFLFLSPLLIGGRKAPTWIEGKGFESLKYVPRIKIEKIQKVDEDILIQGYFQKTNTIM